MKRRNETLEVIDKLEESKGKIVDKARYQAKYNVTLIDQLSINECIMINSYFLTSLIS